MCDYTVRWGSGEKGCDFIFSASKVTWKREGLKMRRWPLSNIETGSSRGEVPHPAPHSGCIVELGFKPGHTANPLSFHHIREEGEAWGRDWSRQGVLISRRQTGPEVPGSPWMWTTQGRGLASPPASMNGRLEAKSSFLLSLPLLLYGNTNFSQPQSQPELLKMD